jgi:hypothetical protein
MANSAAILNNRAKRRYFSTDVLWKERVNDCVAEDAVSCELFSGPNSLLTGKNTGNIVALAAIFWANFRR